ncbi:hypothetical protein CYY_008471 [Polysphondylium violaceum]|uniref:Ankyrin repeat protein n=1 Tax=Polysphondylium violaceum TaxID=133409 RepID=A0A8J4PLK5_9MYCE|nr:hypothetical protein CYY_008471 [Polysphondylium violaceum]
MIDQLFQKVFNNKFISTTIYQNVHQIQINKNSLKYQDIVDIGWMFRNGHKGLLKEKLDNNSYLYLDNKDLFSEIANKDTELFIQLFKQFKQGALEYYNQAFNRNRLYFLVDLVNIDVVKYLHENGYAQKISSHVNIRFFEFDINILKYYLENGLFSPTLQNLIPFVTIQKRPTPFSKEMVDLMVQFIPSPISVVVAKSFLDSLVTNIVPYVFGATSKLFDQGIQSCKFFGNTFTYNQIVEIIQKKEKELCLKSKLQKEKGFLGANCHVDAVELVANFWEIRMLYGQQAFIDKWKSLSNRIRVTSSKIYFATTTTFCPDDITDDDISVPEIGVDILSACCVTPSLKVIDFISSLGYSDNLIMDTMAGHMHPFLIQLVAITDQNERDIIVKLCKISSSFMIDLIYYCCQQTNVESFTYYFTLFKEQINEDAIHEYYECALNHRQYEICKLMESHGYLFSKFFDTNNRFHLIYLYLSNTIQGDSKDQVIQNKLLNIAIDSNDFFGLKYVFNNYQCESFDRDTLIKIGSRVYNLSIIDYICKNACFSDPNFINELIEIATINNNKILIQYFINEKYLYN